MITTFFDYLCMIAKTVMQQNQGKLDQETFNRIVKSTALISIDLVPVSEDGQVLLGFRKNRPAQGYWFVPGGRILKDETINQAFQRISEAELGICGPLLQPVFLGVYEHLHPDDNFAGEEGYGTHYIVLAHSLRVRKQALNPPEDQHDRYRWFSVPDLLDDATVHPYTKDYFNGTVPLR